MNAPAALRSAPLDPFELGRAGLRDLLRDEPAYRVGQVEAWLRKGVDDPEAMTDLPAGLRARLQAVFVGGPEVLRHRVSDAGLTHKVLLRSCAPDRPTDAGVRQAEAGVRQAAPSPEAVESVLMLYPRGRGAGASPPRATVCVSTQAGCAMACPFCATGQAGLRRQLSLGEVLRQVTVMQRFLAGGVLPPDPSTRGVSVSAAERGWKRHTPGAVWPQHVTNVVFMGMGEPLANLDVTIEAVRWLHDPEGFGLSARNITVSTVGLVPGIRRLAALGLPITLAVSLHAPNDALRDDLVPINRQFPLAVLLAACREYVEATRRRLTFEYVLIDGVNDALEHARELADLVRREAAGAGPLSHVNLIPMNATPGISWHAPPPARQRAFRDILVARGIPATIRGTRGADIDAACGQLYADHALGSGRMLPSASRAWRRWELAGGSP